MCGEGKQGRFHMKGDIHVNRYSTRRLQRELNFHCNSVRESIHQRVFYRVLPDSEVRLCAPVPSSQRALTPAASSSPALPLSPLLTVCQVETFFPKCPTVASDLLR